MKTTYVCMNKKELDAAVEMGIVELCEDDKKALEWQDEEYGGFVIEITDCEKFFWDKDVFGNSCLYFLEPYAELVTDRQIVDGVQSGKIHGRCCEEVYVSGTPEDEVAIISVN